MQEIEYESSEVSALFFGSDTFILFHLLKIFENLPLNNFVDKDISGLINKTSPEKANIQVVDLNSLDQINENLLKSVNFVFYAHSMMKKPNEWEEEKIKFTKIREQLAERNPKWQVILRNSSKDVNHNLLKQVVEDVSNKNNQQTTIVLQDCFGPMMNLSEDWEISKHLRSVRDRHSLIVEGDGMESTFPLYVEDVVDFLTKAMFSDSHASGLQQIQGQKEWTSLNLLYAIREEVFKKSGELVEISFEPKEPTKNNSNLVHENEEGISENTSFVKINSNIRDGVQKTLTEILNGAPKDSLSTRLKTNNKKDSKADVQNKSFSKNANIDQLEKSTLKDNVSKTNKDENNNKNIAQLLYRSFLSLLGIAVFLTLGMTVYIATGNTISFELAVSAWEEYAKGNLEKTIQLSNKSISVARNTSQALLFLNNVMSGNMFSRFIPNEDEYVWMIEDSASVLNKTALVINDASLLIHSFLQESSGNAQSQIDSLYQSLATLENELSHLSLNLTEKPNSKSILMQKDQNNIVTYLRGVVKQKEIVKQSIELVSILERMIGPGKKKYLVLFQNSAELRPTGGFIDAVINIELHDGKLEKFEVLDVNELDSQLKGNVEPPLMLKKYTNESSWYLRDGNWDPDFPTTAQQIKWFYEKETGENVNGVIALNDLVIEDVLSVIGPMKLETSTKSILNHDLSSTLVNEQYEDYFQGSHRKIEIIEAMFSELLQNLENVTPSQLRFLTETVLTNLINGEIALVLFNGSDQLIVSEQGWDGSLKNISCSKIQEIDKVCIPLYIAVRDANLGINQVNSKIVRDLNLEGDLKNNSFLLRIVYENESQRDSWPEGKYKNYLRLYLGENANLDSLRLDGKVVQPQEIDIRSEHNKQSIGIYIEVPVQSHSVVEYAFHMVNDSMPVENGLMKIFMQKQPGTRNDQYIVKLNNSGLILNENNKAMSSSSNDFVWNWSTIGNVSLDIDFNFPQVVK